MHTSDIFILSARRTAIGTFGGALKDVPLCDLATVAVTAALSSSQVDPERMGHVVMGNVIPTEPHDAYVARVAAMRAGIPKETPAYNVNRLCGSGLQAVIGAAHTLMLGDAEFAIGAGVESMSRGPYLLPAARWGARMGNGMLQDYMLGVLHDPFQGMHMGVTAENVAERNGISRQLQDELALADQLRAAHAIAQGYFKGQIAPVDIHARTGSTQFSVDEHPRATSLEQLASMRPAFKKDGTVTAGNASGLNDGAAALVLASAGAVTSGNLTPMARLVAYAHAGVEPELMGLGPVPATRLALKRAGLTINDMDVIEANIAFAAQACAVMQELDMDPAKVNPNGSGIALGHPVGATGAIIATKAIHELHRIQGRYALATMCIGGGQGIAVIFERV
ncbi:MULTISPECIES: acetyl-CoA C-acyltransferase family protein [unclassified Pseudomonas]|uniref:acetyl-CoA C-acyltransferase family protein n=1 Tax=unclassified Pseudomonas TaxID=196821 RepID=UPI001474B8CF|nr:MULTISPECIES: acetyl-CoA C-acyltransferase family protein [unclassified Pseudomonas]NMY38058.1 acetyl-CoA C-acyltransferase family protein [Pseudomonas sp. WS 5078]NMY60975.1 acetyl-CoA C-acyltransferase family protein [Pseudomonas sp. WS 5354]NMY74345.1 acetyl-CoA C-acyltransferase family protein [Pseudomonas sp. WS 5071]